MKKNNGFSYRGEKYILLVSAYLRILSAKPQSSNVDELFGSGC